MDRTYLSRAPGNCSPHLFYKFNGRVRIWIWVLQTLFKEVRINFDSWDNSYTLLLCPSGTFEEEEKSFRWACEVFLYWRSDCWSIKYWLLSLVEAQFHIPSFVCYVLSDTSDLRDPVQKAKARNWDHSRGIDQSGEYMFFRAAPCC